jgi:hypothetical protein
MGVLRTAAAALAALVLGAGAAAQTGPSADGAGDEPVRVYTNADLERFGPPSPGPEPATVGDDRGWEFVREFLAREHARLDAERAWDLERRRVEIEEERVLRERWRTVWYYPGYGYTVGYPGCADEKRKRYHALPHGTSPGGRIRPIHAGPTKAQRMRAQAIRRSGADAFPERGRPAKGR